MMPEHYKEIQQRKYRKLRLRALQIVSGLKEPLCTNCGCSEFEVLELHHIDGTGKEDRKSRKTDRLWRDIRDGIEDIENYDVLCKLCNMRDHLERKYKTRWEIKLK